MTLSYALPDGRATATLYKLPIDISDGWDGTLIQRTEADDN
jgi:hypothetical protein